MADSMHQPRDANGRFSSAISKDQFEEYRRATEQRFIAAEAAVATARKTIEDLTKTHAEAHSAQHADNKEALTQARIGMDDRVKKLEGALDTRLRTVEDASLVSATIDDVKSVKSGLNKTGIAAAAAVVMAIVNLVKDMGG